MSSPTIYDYASLCTAIASWLNRTDLSANIPDFIRNVEVSINRNPDLRTHYQLYTVTAAVAANTPYVQLPGDFEEARSVGFTGAPLLNLGNYPAEVIRNADVNNQYTIPQNATPSGFTFTQGYIMVDPALLAANTLELSYYATLPPLDDYRTTNWLLDRFPDIYLYGALAESAPYLKDDARTGIWASRYQQAVSDLQASSDQRKHSGGPLRYRPRAIL